MHAVTPCGQPYHTSRCHLLLQRWPLHAMGDLQLRLWHHLPHWHCRQLQNRWVPWATLACSQTCKKRKSKHERTFSPKKLAQKNAQTRWQWNSRQNTTNVYFLSFFKRPFIHNFASTYKKYQMKEVSMVWNTSRTMATWGPPASAIAWQRKLAQLCYLPKTKHSCANFPNISTAGVAGGGKIQSWNLQVGVHMVFPWSILG